MALIGFGCLCVFSLRGRGEVSIPGEVQKLIVLGWQGNHRRKARRAQVAGCRCLWAGSRVGMSALCSKSLQAQTGSRRDTSLAHAVWALRWEGRARWKNANQSSSPAVIPWPAFRWYLRKGSQVQVRRSPPEEVILWIRTHPTPQDLTCSPPHFSCPHGTDKQTGTATCPVTHLPAGRAELGLQTSYPCSHSLTVRQENSFFHSAGWQIQFCFVF